MDCFVRSFSLSLSWYFSCTLAHILFKPFSPQSIYHQFDAFVVIIIIIAVFVALAIHVLFSHSIAIKFRVQNIVFFLLQKQTHAHTKYLAQNNSEEKMNLTNYHKFIVKETATHWNFHIDLDIKLTSNKIDYFMATAVIVSACANAYMCVWLFFYSIASNY